VIYEDGVLKPLEPVDLPDHEILEVRVEALGGQSGEIVQLGGAWAQYLSEGVPSFEEMEAIVRSEQQQWLDRLLRQTGEDEEDHAAPNA
jgi:predicted DNA-binding antitoxin AbrB/MazE fold protein